MKKDNERIQLPDSVKHEGLVTERDIDEQFGLFTEEPEIGSIRKKDTESEQSKLCNSARSGSPRDL